MSIFARQLQYVLKQLANSFGQLYNIRIEGSGYDGRPLSAEKIKRLRLAISDNYKHSVTLNPDELEAVKLAFSLDLEEMLRLRAALAAESIQRFLSDRIEPEKALLVGEALFQLLFDADDSAFIALRNRMVNNIRGGDSDSDEEIMAKQNEESDLEPAIEVYESALLWIDTARVTQNPILRQGYLAMVTFLLTNAQELISCLPGSMYETSQRTEWRQAVAQAILEVNDLKEL